MRSETIDPEIMSLSETEIDNTKKFKATLSFNIKKFSIFNNLSSEK